MIELKPCPFCGGNAAKATFATCVSIQCLSDVCLPNVGVYYVDEAEAVTAWNTRAAPTMNLDMLRANVQSLLDDCAHILKRRRIGIKEQHAWDGVSLNAVRDIQQRVGVMLALLDGEAV